MAYNGYWRLGDTEIINAPRTQKYVDTLMPTFGLEGCDDCDGLADALGAVQTLGPEERVMPGVVHRTNLAKDPRGLVSWNGNTSNQTVTYEITGGPGDGVDTWTKATFTAAGTGSYRTLSTSPGLDNFCPVIPGETYVLAVEEIHSHTPSSRIGPYVTWYNAAGTATTQSIPFLPPGPNGQWNRAVGTVVAPADAAYARLALAAGLDTGWPVGAYIGASKWMMVAQYEWDLWGHDYFDGDTGVDTLEQETVWTGLPNRSTSQEVVYDTRRPVLSDNRWRTPVLDDAPWVDSSNPALNDFWGVYPLSVSGADDSTRTLPVTELTTDGAITGLPRAASREIRFDVMLVGRTKQAVTAGLHWLNRALDENRCDTDTLGCSGTTLSFFSDCPPACDYSACPDEPVEWGVGDPYRINWVWNPRVADDVDSVPYTNYGIGPIVTMPDGFARADWSAPPSTFGSGILYQHNTPFVVDGLDEPTFYPAGTPVSALVNYVEISRAALTVRVMVELLSSTGTIVQTIQGPSRTGDTLYTDMGASGIATTAFYGYRIVLYITSASTTIVAGDWLKATRYMFETSAPGGQYFDGYNIYATWQSVIPEGMQAYWVGGGANEGPSVIAPEADDIDMWSVNNFGDEFNPAWRQLFGGVCGGPHNLSIEGTGSSLVDLRLTRVLTGLIPGQWYRVRSAALGYTTVSSSDYRNIVSMSVRGKPGSVTYPEGTDLCDEPVGQALWFQATSPVEYLDYVLPASPLEPSESTINVSYLSVRRATADFNIYSTDFVDDGTALNGWTMGTSAGTYTVTNSRQGSGWVEDVPTVRFTATGIMTTVPDNQVIVRRSIRGLTPGAAYTARFGYDWDSVQPSPPNATVGLEIAGVSQEVTLNPSDFPTTRVLEVSFVAASEQHDMIFRLGAPYALPNTGNYIAFNLIYASVERNETDTVPYPDAAQDYRRVLYRVAALTGPTITEEYDKTCGYMVRVSFGLVAGVPHQYGPLLSAGSALGGSSSPLQQVDCVNGAPVRVNYILNPSFEYGTTAWALDGAGTGTYTRTNSFPQMWETAFGGRSGIYMGQIVGNGTSVEFGARTVGTIPINAFQWAAVRMLVASDTVPLPGTGGVRVGIYWSTGAVDYSDYVNPTFYAGDEIVMSARAPEGATSYYVRVMMYSGDSSTNLPSGKRLWWDAAISTISDSAGQAVSLLSPYFDGDYPNSAWTGTAGNSTSSWEQSAVSDLIDPDCPPLPAPPQPPSIDQDCIEEPTSWTRYTIYIPADQVPLFSSSVPVVTLRTGNATARQVRMRWYPNPDAQNITELPACSFQGEVIVSYVPPQAEMVVDAIAKEATAVVSGGPEQPATQLLYGPDGGPMEWPELSCNVGYVFTVDVDAADDVSELDVLLSLGLKV